MPVPIYSQREKCNFFTAALNPETLSQTTGQRCVHRGGVSKWPLHIQSCYLGHWVTRSILRSRLFSAIVWSVLFPNSNVEYSALDTEWGGRGRTCHVWCPPVYCLYPSHQLSTSETTLSSSQIWKLRLKTAKQFALKSPG